MACEAKYDDALISVICLTYNHGQFIEKTLESFLSQHISVKYEVLIADDCSTDLTTEIARRYAEKYPDIIRIVSGPLNVGAEKNFSRAFGAAKGKYIAHCEGDDYWCDDTKLQKQYDFMQANPEYALCFHDTKVVDENDNLVMDSQIPVEFKRDHSSDELLCGKGWIKNLTIFYRKPFVEIPPEMFKVKNSDTFLYTALGLLGNGKWLGDVVKPGAYRIHSGGVWSAMNYADKLSSKLNTYFWICTYLDRLGRPEAAAWYQKLQNAVAAFGKGNHLSLSFSHRVKELLFRKIKIFMRW